MNYTHVEEYIIELFTSIGVTSPTDLCMQVIAAKLGVVITYRDRLFKFGNEIVLAPGSHQAEWQAFGHEICHYLRHAGSQLNMPPLFVQLQETQADYFAYHFCAPTFMLEKMELAQHRKENIWNICNTFNVDYEFAKKRLEMYQNKMICNYTSLQVSENAAKYGLEKMK